MASPTTLGPLRVDFSETQVVFRFDDPGAMTLEIPAQLEEQLRSLLSRHAEDLADKTMVVDLARLPALSSRQLGMLLTIRKVCEPYGSVTLREVGEPILVLLESTRMIKLFKVVS